MDDQRTDREGGDSAGGMRFSLKQLFFAVVVVAVSLFALMFVFELLTDYPRTTARGNVIVAALRKYHNEHGGYPSELAELCPVYLTTVPQATWGLGEWIYRREGDTFTLTVHETENVGDGQSHWLRYDGSDGWQMGD